MFLLHDQGTVVRLGRHSRRLIGISREITWQKKIEEELREKARELTVMNIELEQFAYAVSHDLQEPLRVVSGYVDLLSRRLQGKLDDESAEFMHYIADGTQRMQQLIRDLLNECGSSSRISWSSPSMIVSTWPSCVADKD